MNSDDLAELIFRAIDWDFVEVFDDSGEGYPSPRALCEHIARHVPGDA